MRPGRQGDAVRGDTSAPGTPGRPASPAGTDGYAGEADRLAEQYESIAFADVHAPLLHLFPPLPARVCDIGAGTGRDAAALARLGHRVVAVEPTAELRAHGRRIHAGVAIDWVDDALPDLPALHRRGETYDLILLTAVLMHLDAAERRAAVAALAGLLAPQGLVVLSLRHGPVPPGRRMFDVRPEEVVALGAGHGLRLVEQAGRGDMFARASVTWSLLALRRP